MENLAQQYKAKITFCPKYHCELNPIEGLWCFQKTFIRRRTNQTLNSLIRLYHESREEFIRKFLNNKLIKRFWLCIEAYKNKETYKVVLTKFFSGKSSGENKEHLKISNANLN